MVTIDNIADDVYALYKIIAERNNVYVVVLIVGLIISFLSTCFLIIDCVLVSNKKKTILSTHWITANTGLEAYDILDYDCRPVEVQLHASVFAPEHWAVLLNEDTQYEEGRPVKSIVHVTCRPQMKKALMCIKSMDITLSLAVIILSFGNIIVANIGIIICYTSIYDAALVAALAANSLLIIGPTFLACIYVFFTRYNFCKNKEPTMVEINAATKMSSSGKPQRMHPIWPLCWIATKNTAEDLNNLWKTPIQLYNARNEWSRQDKSSVYEKMLTTLDNINDTYKVISLSNLRSMCIDVEWMDILDELVVNTYANREIHTNDFMKNKSIKNMAANKDNWFNFSHIRGIDALRWKKDSLNVNQQYYLVIGTFGQRMLEISPAVSADITLKNINQINKAAINAKNTIIESIQNCLNVITTEMSIFINVVNVSYRAPGCIIVTSNKAIDFSYNITDEFTAIHEKEHMCEQLDYVSHECNKCTNTCDSLPNP